MNAAQIIASETPDLRLELRSRNNVLWHAIYDVYQTVAEFCRENDVSQQSVSSLLNLKQSPYGSRDELRTIAKRLCDIVGIGADELFPKHLYTGKFSLRIAEVESRRFLSLRSAERLALPPNQEDGVFADERHKAVLDTLKTLTTREEKVITQRFGFDGSGGLSLDEVAANFGVSRERIRQIEMKALRKLRHSSRNKKLRPFITESRWVKESVPDATTIYRRDERVDRPPAAILTSDFTQHDRTMVVVRSPFVTFVRVSPEELRSGSWVTDDCPPPPGGTNPIITKVRVTKNDIADKITLVVYGTATRTINFR